MPASNRASWTQHLTRSKELLILEADNFNIEQRLQLRKQCALVNRLMRCRASVGDQRGKPEDTWDSWERKFRSTNRLRLCIDMRYFLARFEATNSLALPCRQTRESSYF